jgi:hypothetical protein
MDFQSRVLPVLVTSVHVEPLSVEVQMLPGPSATAASLAPSLDDVMQFQLRALPVLVTSVHVKPLSVEVQMLPP